MSALALRGPAWVAVRAHRRALQIVFALLVLSAGAMAGLRWWLAEARDDMFGTDSLHYNQALGGVQIAVDYGGTAMVLLPMFVGAFVAGPMIARELESGAYKLLWTQSVTPVRWFATKLALPAVVVVIGATILVLAFRLGWAQVSEAYRPWYESKVYEAIGPVAVANSLLGAAIGALVGLLVRRTVPAMAATGLVTGFLLLVLGTARDGLWATRTATSTEPDALDIFPDNAMPVGEWMTTADGKRVSDDACWNVDDFEQCLDVHNITGSVIEYHPASHFWPLQLVETGIALAIAALATAAAFYVVRRRHA
ncbi:ABC transporter permease [Streptomyces sp. ISL-98]|uniref:ABC transporter permease n=1 Tax=Streptomyces sp. ISL-98 TaxID=2819192 RepID=UPI001BEA02EE|nr:ABC transporter permease [Streptomyces sp. ISL-98]MBT2510863.1 ABC transporter permease [Streptomyces sp. ISL-98]